MVFEVDVPAPVDVSITPAPVVEVQVAPVLPSPPPDPQVIAGAVTDYLTTNPVLPPQSGQAGNVLSTDGADPSWMDITPPVTLTLLLDNALV
ncbi:hypothetical protein BST10_18730 [Mycolicibacter algericus DSM 45454]|uniref:Uncharacterized protein n=1 Tax=Mycolicibacter algericus DSM 45454 TaxID=723879 RepID=A0ABX3RKH5_MYCAL|nr:hypothetical protein BST10_18730 [Mycolicibacter algericus DSM 45454]